MAQEIILALLAVLAGGATTVGLYKHNLTVRPQVYALISNINCRPEDWDVSDGIWGKCYINKVLKQYMYIDNTYAPGFNYNWRERRLLRTAFDKMMADKITNTTLRGE